MTFGVIDAPLPPEELEKDGLAQWPMVMGGIVTIVNLDGVKPGGIIIDGPTPRRGSRSRKNGVPGEPRLKRSVGIMAGAAQALRL